MEKLFNYKSVCRTCLSESVELLSLFSVIKVAGTQIHHLDLIQKLCDIKIKQDDGLPGKLCLNCIQKIKIIQDFMGMCRSSEVILRMQKEKETNNIKIRKIRVSSEKSCDTKDIGRPKSEAEDDKKPAKGKRSRKNYKCASCGSCFTTKIKFQRHEKAHQGNPFVCRVNGCSQTFLKKNHLTSHMRAHMDNKEKKFACDNCGKQFMYYNMLQRHKLNHSTFKPFPCPKCSKGCLTPENLRRHLKAHMDYKPFKCETCSENFISLKVLEGHTRKHTKEKPPKGVEKHFDMAPAQPPKDQSETRVCVVPNWENVSPRLRKLKTDNKEKLAICMKMHEETSVIEDGADIPDAAGNSPARLEL